MNVLETLKIKAPQWQASYPTIEEIFIYQVLLPELDNIIVAISSDVDTAVYELADSLNSTISRENLRSLGIRKSLFLVAKSLEDANDGIRGIIKQDGCKSEASLMSDEYLESIRTCLAGRETTQGQSEKQAAPAGKEGAPVDASSPAPGNDYFRELGKKGGQKEKHDKGILQAVIEYIQENPKRIEYTNEKIANGFCKSYSNSRPCCVDGNSYEVWCEGKAIHSSRGINGKLKKSHEKTHNKKIEKSTLISNYIPRAKKDIKEKSIKE